MYAALLPLMRTPRLSVVDWTDARFDLNGLVRFADRRNLIYALVPSHFKRSLTISNTCFTINKTSIVRIISAYPLLPWKRNKYYVFRVCVCSLSYPAYKMIARCFPLWSAFLYHSFPHYLINGTIFVKKVIEYKMCILIFCTISVLNITILIIFRRDIVINVHRPSCKISIIIVRY